MDLATLMGAGPARIPEGLPPGGPPLDAPPDLFQRFLSQLAGGVNAPPLTGNPTGATPPWPIAGANVPDPSLLSFLNLTGPAEGTESLGLPFGEDGLPVGVPEDGADSADGGTPLDPALAAMLLALQSPVVPGSVAPTPALEPSLSGAPSGEPVVLSAVSPGLPAVPTASVPVSPEPPSPTAVTAGPGGAPVPVADPSVPVNVPTPTPTPGAATASTGEIPEAKSPNAPEESVPLEAGPSEILVPRELRPTAAQRFTEPAPQANSEAVESSPVSVGESVPTVPTALEGLTKRSIPMPTAPAPSSASNATSPTTSAPTAVEAPAVAPKATTMVFGPAEAPVAAPEAKPRPAAHPAAAVPVMEPAVKPVEASAGGSVAPERESSEEDPAGGFSTAMKAELPSAERTDRPPIAFREVLGPTGTDTGRVDRANVIRQVADRIETLAASRPREGVVVHLNPPDLGHVTVVVKAMGNLVETQLSASDEQVRIALEHSRAALISTLEQRGLTVQSVHVSAQTADSTSAFAGQSQPQRQASQTSTAPSVGPETRTPTESAANASFARTNTGGSADTLDYWI